MNSISLVASSSKDILVDSQNQIIEELIGGPIYFLKNALKDLSIPYKIFPVKEMDVEILVKDRREFGKVKCEGDAILFPIKKVSSWVIISTILRELDLSNLNDYKGKVFLDIQGFVRDGSSFGKKRFWKESEAIAKYIYCLKGTEEEISHLPKKVIEDQKKRLLVITNGTNNIVIYDKGNLITVPILKKVKPKNTVGAGDTFLAYFVGSMYLGKNSEEAVKFAVEKTTNFLENK